MIMEKCKRIINSKYFVLCYSFIVCAWTLIIMIHYSGYSFWGDELATVLVAGTHNTLLETIKTNLTGEVYGGLIFYPLANIWMKIVPYGTKWALLICELAVCAGMVILGQIAERIRGKLAGVLTVSLACVTSYLALQGGYEFRCYGVNFFCSTLLLLAYFRKMDVPSYPRLLIYAFTALLLTFSHFTSVFFLFSLFLADVYCYFKKRITIRHILPYLIWGSVFIPYLLYAYFSITEKIDNYWTPKPQLSGMITLPYLMLQNPVLCLIYYCGALWLIYRLIKNLIAKRSTTEDEYSGAWIILRTIICFTLVNFAYSWINSSYSMWGQRYFFSIMGSLILVCGIFAGDLLTRVFSSKIQSYWKALVSVLLVIIAAYLELSYVRDLKANRFPETISQPFEQAAEFLREQDDLWDKDTAIYCSAFNIEAWQYYLAHGDMTPGLFNFVPLSIESIDLSKYETIYVTEIQNPIPQSTWDYLAETHDGEEIHHDYKIYRYTRR